jgi:RNA polymerase sigma-70 factor (ECF subfamily)
MSVTLLPAAGRLVEERLLDDELMAQVARGSEFALRSLIHRHRDRLVRLSTRLTRDRGLAEDVAQETFIRLVDHARAYEGRGQFVSWLYTIARRLSFNVNRARQRRPEVPLEAAHDRPSDATPEIALELQEVRRAIASLPKRQREALWLKAGEGRSYKEIAKALECSESDVANAIFRGRETLARFLRA